jgi:rhodanese-related sulfurtransferase
MKKSHIMMFMVVVVGLAVCFPGAAGAADVERMTIEELKSMLGNPNVIIVDVRQPEDFNDSDTKIQGAVREDPSSVSTWMSKYPKDKTLIFYCA